VSGERRIRIRPEVAERADRLFRQQEAATVEAATFMHTLALSLGVDPATVDRIDTNRLELIVRVEPRVAWWRRLIGTRAGK
jgi:hypothetical protein